jgi:hypothetical protein
MSALQLTITNAGLSAIAQAGTLGPVVISQVAIGSGSWATAPTPTATALVTEIKRITPQGSSTPAPGVIHITAADTSADAYSVKEIALYTSTGVLFAIAGGTAVFLNKASGSVALTAVDLSLANVPVGSVTIGDANFQYPPATETVQGVLEIATAAEVAAGTDDLRAVTPAKLALAGFVKKSGDTMTGLLTLAGAPTAALHAATKAYAEGTSSKSPNGYAVLPSGIIVQWGTFTADGASTATQLISLPITFPNAIAFAVASEDGANTGNVEVSQIDWSTSGRTTTSRLAIFSNYIGPCRFFAIGY